MGEIIRFKKFVKEDLDEEDYNQVLKEGGLCWRCDCGSHTFFIIPEGPICRQCGEPVIGWDY